jgi:hypothetical protein
LEAVWRPFNEKGFIDRGKARKMEGYSTGGMMAWGVVEREPQ